MNCSAPLNGDQFPRDDERQRLAADDDTPRRGPNYLDQDEWEEAGYPPCAREPEETDYIAADDDRDGGPFLVLLTALAVIAVVTIVVVMACFGGGA